MKLRIDAGADNDRPNQRERTDHRASHASPVTHDCWRSRGERSTNRLGIFKRFDECGRRLRTIGGIDREAARYQTLEASWYVFANRR